jgi:FkbM family methyltransferase
VTTPVVQPLKQEQFRPTALVRFMRVVAKACIFILGLDGRSRFGNEMLQLLNPSYTTRFRSGVSLIFRTGHGRLLWRAKEAEHLEPSIIHWIDTMTAEDCFFDIGANVGTYALYSAKRGIRSVAVEVEPNNYQLLVDNILLNQLSETCIPIPLGCSDTTTHTTLYMKAFSKGDALHSINRPSPYLGASDRPTCISVLSMKLDDIIEVFGLRLPTKLKIDVDGNELDVLRGATNVLEHVNEIHIELDSEQQSHRDAKALLLDRGFSISTTEIISSTRVTTVMNYIFAKAPKSLES